MFKMRWLAVTVVIWGLLTALPHVQAQAIPSEYFPATGHTIRGEFLNYFNANGRLDVFGYPITEEFVENGRLVQYFQRLRLDAYPENSPPFNVQTGPIGELLGRSDPPIPSSDIPAPNDPDHRYFPETGHTVSYAFLNYFDAHGGADFLGFPITEFKMENGLIVQYFQRAQMEWHPDLPPEQRVRLGHLGETYALLRLDPALLRPPPDKLMQQPISGILRLKPSATLQAAVTGRTGAQTLHVYVLDQLGRPVQDANVAAAVHFPWGDQVLVLPQTNERGYTSILFDLGQLKPGQRIRVDVRVGFAALSASTRTSFLVWW